MSLTVVFARHGESTANIDLVFANRPSIPGDLTPTGTAQAEALACSLEGMDISRIYSSPLARARKTATLIAERFSVPVETTDALREYDVGDYEGLPYGGEHAWRWDRYTAVEDAWFHGHRDACHPGGETLAELESRFLTFMDEITERHTDRETILAISHGGFLRAVLPALLPDISRAHAREHTLGHRDRVIVLRQGGRWRCVEWIDPSRTPTPG